MLNNLKQEYKDFPEEKIQDQQLQQIIYMIEGIYKEVTDIYQIELAENHWGTYVKYKKKSKQIRRQKMERMFKRLIEFLYTLRTWLTGEEIILRLGGKSVNDKGLLYVDIPQNKWLKDTISININSKVISISYAINKMMEDEKYIKNNDDSLKGYWSKIQEWGDYKKIYSTGDKPDAIENYHAFYQKDTEDEDIYIKFRKGKSGTYAIPYYLKKYQYNMGWLYEWFMDLIENGDYTSEQLKIYFDKAKHPLAILFYNHFPDKKMSLQGGDVSNIQVKYGNKKLLTFQQLLLYIQQLHDIIINYQQNKETGINETVKELKSLFIQSNQNQINEDVKNKLEEDLELLNLKNLT